MCGKGRGREEDERGRFLKGFGALVLARFSTKTGKSRDSLGELLLDLGCLLLGLFHVLHEASEVGERVAAAALFRRNEQREEEEKEVEEEVDDDEVERWKKEIEMLSFKTGYSNNRN